MEIRFIIYTYISCGLSPPEDADNAEDEDEDEDEDEVEVEDEDEDGNEDEPSLHSLTWDKISSHIRDPSSDYPFDSAPVQSSRVLTERSQRSLPSDFVSMAATCGIMPFAALLINGQLMEEVARISPLSDMLIAEYLFELVENIPNVTYRVMLPFCHEYEQQVLEDYVKMIIAWLNIRFRASLAEIGHNDDYMEEYMTCPIELIWEGRGVFFDWQHLRTTFTAEHRSSAPFLHFQRQLIDLTKSIVLDNIELPVLCQMTIRTVSLVDHQRIDRWWPEDHLDDFWEPSDEGDVDLGILNLSAL